MGNNPLEIATYLFEFTCEFREILSNQCRIISANSVQEFTFDDWHVNWPLNICSSHFCPAFLAMGNIDRKFNNQNVTKVTQAKIPSPKFPLSIVAKAATICMYYVSKRGPNTCKKQMFSLPKPANKLTKKLL